MQHYRESLALLTDLYQLTMAYGYWKLGRSEQNAVFHLFFRKSPFSGSFAVAAGLGPALEFLESFRFDQEDLEYLQSLTGNDGKQLFSVDFLQYLSDLRLTCDINAIPEGTVVFGHEPLIRVEGPILQCQLLETALLNIINFQTLIATKAARICMVAEDQPVLEFGLRRAQGIDGGLAASRAAYLGGCDATSNVLAGKLYGIPVKGTHAHSWVMSFEEEATAFEEYAKVLPNNCVFLVDTYDTLEGVRKAIRVGKQLRDQGHEMVGIRLDSGDLSELSTKARKLLDASQFKSAAIIASNDLDEFALQKLKRSGAQIAVWGVGTKLATAYDQPALGGVYKLGAIQGEDGTWSPKIKRSEQKIKTSIPGKLQIKRYSKDGTFTCDLLVDELQGIDARNQAVSLADATTTAIDDLGEPNEILRPVMQSGKVVWQEDLKASKARASSQISMLAAPFKRLEDAAPYPVALDVGLHELREQLIQSDS